MKVYLVFAALMSGCGSPRVSQSASQSAADLTANTDIREVKLFDGAQHADLSAKESAIFRLPFNAIGELFPSSYPKLVGPLSADGVSLKVGGVNVQIQTHVDESGIEVRECDDKGGAPMPYLPYDSTYVLTVDGTQLSMPVGSFKVLAVTSADDRALAIYGAPNTPFEDNVVEKNIAANRAHALRVLFSGPVSQTSMQGAVLTKGLNRMSFVIAPSSEDGEIQALDARVALLFPQGGFEPGTYTLMLPQTVTDDQSVTGAPVALKAPFWFTFTIETNDEMTY